MNIDKKRATELAERMLECCHINGRKIVLRGLGKLFYQEGFPVSLGAQALEEKGYEVSWIHVADELLKHGWSAETVIKRLREDIVDGGVEKEKAEPIIKFCNADYEGQREQIFQYLFGRPSNDPENAKDPDINNIVT